jgi:hypothetical protein
MSKLHNWKNHSKPETAKPQQHKLRIASLSISPSRVITAFVHISGLARVTTAEDDEVVGIREPCARNALPRPVSSHEPDVPISGIHATTRRRPRAKPVQPLPIYISKSARELAEAREQQTATS